ncbi:MAG TPA: LysR family transcriptional regulator [Xanthobacteraceae bacterium]|nr:LysR family transcriptional regulator [Xanthobacteraceae bacterium]
MDLRHLRTFVTVAEQGTVSKAALRLAVAQPALSRQIADLEAELGVKLFDRIRRRLVLTGQGERMLAECRDIVNAVDSLGDRAELLRRGDSGVLKIAATPQMIDGVFSTFLHRYAARFPDVQIRLTEAVGTEPYAKLDRGELHLVISYLQSIETESHEFETFPLPPLEFLAAGHESLVLGSGGNIEISALAAHPLLLLEPSFAARTTFDAACRVAGIKPEIFVESRAPHTLLALAEAGHGVAIVPSVLPTHRYRLSLARVTYRRRPLRGLLTVLWDRRRALPQYAKDFCEVLDTYMRGVFPISRATRPKAGLKAKR